MKIDARELQEITTTAKAGRPQLYTGIHKALRARMATVLTSLGRVDADDDQHCREIVADLAQLLHVLQGHVETENALVHPAIEARRPGALAHIAAEHAAHETAIARLHGETETLLAVTGAERAAWALFLYREFSRFIAENFEHMLGEESENQALLWSAYSDDELVALHDTIVASLPPEKMAVLLPWFVVALSPAERREMFIGMRANAPAPAFAAALEVAQSCLPAREWAKLAAALAIEAGEAVAS